MFMKYQFDPKVAAELKSADKAFMVEYIGWSVMQKREQAGTEIGRMRNAECLFEGDYYMWDTFEAWSKRMPWISLSTIKRYIRELRDDGWIKTASLSPTPLDRTLYYTIIQGKYDSASIVPNWHNRFDQNEQMPLGQSDPMRLVHPDTIDGVRMTLCSIPNTQSNTLSNTHNARAREGDIEQIQEGEEQKTKAPELQRHTAIQSKAASNTDVAPKKSKPTELLKTSFSETHEFAPVFTQLLKISLCKNKFDVEEYSQWLKGIMARHKLTAKELRDCAEDWQIYHNDSSEKMKSPKGSFATWLKNYLNERERNGGRTQKSGRKGNDKQSSIGSVTYDLSQMDYTTGWDD